MVYLLKIIRTIYLQHIIDLKWMSEGKEKDSLAYFVKDLSKVGIIWN